MENTDSASGGGSGDAWTGTMLGRDPRWILTDLEEIEEDFGEVKTFAKDSKRVKVLEERISFPKNKCNVN